MRPAYCRLRQGNPNPVVAGHKFCSDCGRWRLVCDFHSDRANSTGLRSNCHPCERIRHRRRQASMTAAQREQQREYQRIWTEVQRRRAGIAPREFKHRRSVVDHIERVMLPREPLVAVLRPLNGQRKQLARRAGVTERTVTRLMTGESKRVRLDVADKLAVALGIPLATIYRKHEPTSRERARS